MLREDTEAGMGRDGRTDGRTTSIVSMCEIIDLLGLRDKGRVSRPSESSAVSEIPQELSVLTR